jgi:chemotaxis family two-component system sensor kinase Cph1
MKVLQPNTDMSDIQIDLNNCDREQIHIPGYIQSHGFLLVIDQEMIIRFHSENIQQYLTELETTLLNQPLSKLEAVLENKTGQPLPIEPLIILGKQNNYEQINPYRIQLDNQPWNLIISSSASLTMLEFEPAAQESDPDLQTLIGSSISEMLGDKNLKSLLINSASQVKKIINYDRVMIYRFAEDGHGEVVAESKNSNLESWLGLHYPASDIPKQARELYKLNLTRLITDVNSVPSRILGSKPAPLDLTNAQLRAVSPIHIQYLKNMGVASSFSISLIYKQQLWGLIACHNYTPRFINYKSRSTARLIGQILSSALEFRQDEENQHMQEAFSNSMEKLTKSLTEHENIDEALTTDAVDNLLSLTLASGVVINYEGRRTKLGITPSDEEIDELTYWIRTQKKDAIYHTDQLQQAFPPAIKYKEIASGVLLCVLSRELKEFIIWFKPEKLVTIKWAGNPEKSIEIDAEGLTHISPRHSFEEWSQTVSGKSDNWKPEEIRSAIRIKEEIAYALNQKAGAIRMLNERLRQAYEELDTFSYTVSHDLKNPISVIKNYVQLLKRDSEISERSLSLLGRIEFTTDKMFRMIQEILEYSRIGRAELEFQEIPMDKVIAELSNELQLIYGHETRIIIGETPAVKGDGLMVQQVFANLISNAVKYSQSSNPAEVHISGTNTGTEICYTIRDNGLGIDEADLPFIFELFKRMENTKHIEGSGVGLAIVKRIVDKHKGRIWAESELEKGSAFYVSFNN